jgi:glycosyltransferase involved in cell wall biosynthesis
MKKLVRITTVPISLNKLLEGQLKFINQYYKVVAISSNAKELSKIGNKEGVETFCVEMTRKITPIKDIIAVFKLYRYFKQTKPFIVHTHTPKAGTLGMLAAKLSRVPVRLHTVAGLPLLEARGLKRLLLDFVEKQTYQNATKVYTNSAGLMKIILNNNFIKPSKLEVIGNGSSNGIDTEYFDPDLVNAETKEEEKKRYGISRKDFVFIFVGRIVTDKGINELVEAFTEINKIYKDAKLLLVGATEEDLDPINTITKNLIDINPNIIATGYIEDVRPYFAISSTLVFPSYREGFPNVIMQAGAMGLPSIVSNINGCNEIIISNKNGIIIKTKNENELYNAMLNIISNKELYNKLKANARKLIVERYEQNTFWNKLLEEYQNIENKDV